MTWDNAPDNAETGIQSFLVCCQGKVIGRLPGGAEAFLELEYYFLFVDLSGFCFS